MATATTPNVGDLVLVDGRGQSTPSGLYVVLQATAPYTVAPVDANANPNAALAVKVAQANLIAVYRQD